MKKFVFVPVCDDPKFLITFFSLNYENSSNDPFLMQLAISKSGLIQGTLLTLCGAQNCLFLLLKFLHEYAQCLCLHHVFELLI
jgi:hypothetical protein